MSAYGPTLHGARLAPKPSSAIVQTTTASATASKTRAAQPAHALRARLIPIRGPARNSENGARPASAGGLPRSAKRLALTKYSATAQRSSAKA